MKTFEERYTAWIDGQLTGDALTAFEQELARRAEAGDAEAAESDKAQALGLRALLREHLQAPALNNAEFFNHQMRERIDTEIDKAARRRETVAQPAWRFPAFAWPFTRLAGAGMLCLFVAGALYYGMMPPRQSETTGALVTTSSPSAPAPADDAVKSDPTPSVQTPVERAPDNQYVSLQPTPTPADLNDDIRVVPAPGSAAKATSLHYDKANVLWVTDLPYLPSTETSPAPAANPVTPAPSAAPSAVP